MSNKPFGKSDMMKKATPFIYARISTEEQSAGDEGIKDPKKKSVIKRQIKQIQDELKKQGLPQAKPENIYAEVASGTKRERKQWLAVRAAAMGHNGKAFVVVKDTTRWARSLRHAVVAWDTLMTRGIPVYAITSNIQTGSDTDLRPDEESWFVLNSVMSAKTSQIQKKKADDSVDRQKQEGVIAGVGSSLYPFASQDPLRVLLANEYMLSQPKGSSRLNAMVEAQSYPNGMKASSVPNLRRKLTEIREKLTEKEFQEWLEFRDFIRELTITQGVDAWTGKQRYLPVGDKKNYWPMRAVMRMSGAYIGKPYDFDKPSVQFIGEVLKEFPSYLSDKDKKRRGKR